MSLPLFINWSYFFSCWCYRCYCWCVLTCYWCTVLIYTLNCYTCSCSDEWFFWYESHTSIWCDCISTFAWNCLRCWAIFECSWRIIIHWNVWISFCKLRLTCLSLALFIFWSYILCCWNNWSNLWCVSCFSWCTVGVLSLNLNGNYITWIGLISWCESDYTCCFINCEATDNLTVWWLSIYWSCWLTIFVKKSNGILVDWCNWVTFCEGNSTSLNYTLRCYWFSRSRCWCYWCYCWCVLTCYWCTILIYTFNCYTCSCSDEWFLWDEGYTSIWSYCISTFAWNYLNCWTIFKCSWRIIIHWNVWISFCKLRLTCLSLALFIFWSYILCCWNNWSNLWCVCCFSWCTVGILSLNLNGNHITWIGLICWCEGYNTCCFINCEGTDNLTVWWLSIYWSCWLTIFVKKSNGILVDWCNWVTFCEGNSTSLNYTLRCYWFSWSCCWCYWCYCWCVCCRSFCSVHVFTNYCYCWYFTNKWFFWNKCNCSVWSYCVSTYSFNLLTCCTIIKFSRNSFVNGYSLFNTVNISSTTFKFWFTFLSRTLNIYSFSRCRCWCYWYNLWSVSSIYFKAICTFSLNFNWGNFTCIRFISWCESYLTCSWINRESTNWCCSIFCVCCCVRDFISIIIQKLVAIFFQRNLFVLTIYINCRTCKSWRSSLYSSLNIFRCCRLCRWSCRKYSWCVFRIGSNCNCITRLISNSCSCLYCYTFCCADKVFFRSKCNCSCRRIDCVCSFARHGDSFFISRLTSCWIH